MSQLQNLINQMNEIKAKMKQDGQAALKEEFKKFFDKYAVAKKIIWVQYTPYFNDGDACVFEVRDFELKANLDFVADDVKAALNTDDDDYDDNYSYSEHCLISTLKRIEDNASNRRWSKEKLRKLSSDESTLIEDFNTLVKASYELPDLFEMIFGDHVRVVASAEGFETFEYSHD